MPPTEVKEKEPERDKLDLERTEFVKAEAERTEKESKVPDPEKPGRAKDGSLTRAGMETLIKRGEAVSHHGKIYSKLDELPEEADLVKGDAAAADAAIEGVDRQMAVLQAQRASLERARTAKPEAAAAHEKAEDKHAQAQHRK